MTKPPLGKDVRHLLTRWAQDQTHLDRMDQILRASLLEGAVGVAEKTWTRQNRPLEQASQAIAQLDPALHLSLTERGWFSLPGQPGYLNLYRNLSTKAKQLSSNLGLNSLQAEEEVANLILTVRTNPNKQVRPLAYLLGKNKSFTIKYQYSVIQFYPYLRKVILNSLLNLRRLKDFQDLRGPQPVQLDPIGETPDWADRTEQVPWEGGPEQVGASLLAYFLHPTHPVGKFLREKMRKVFRDIYQQRQRARPNYPLKIRPSLVFLDHLREEDPPPGVGKGQVRPLRIPSLPEVADRLKVTDRSIMERHLKPMFHRFVEEMKSNPAIRNPLEKFLTEQNFPKEEVEDFFERPNPFEIRGRDTSGNFIIRVLSLP